MGTGAIAVHLAGDAGILLADRKRAAFRKCVTANTVAKPVLTGAALAATGYVRVLGKRIDTDLA